MRQLILALFIILLLPFSAGARNVQFIDTDKLIQGEARTEIAKRLTPGLWRITWIEPQLLPNMKAQEIVAQRCYTAQDAKNGVNIALPLAQQKQCTSMTTMVGDDIVFDTDCPQGYQRLRLSWCGERMCGSYTYTERNHKRIFDTTLFLDKILDHCQQ